MTSLRQLAANRRNASKSTGPLTETGKQRSRRNAVRHGLTAETVIGALEDAEDYKLFEAAITADFVPQTAVERQLVLRLASLLWRLRRATSIETGMIQNSTVHIRSLRPADESEPTSSGSFEDTAQHAYSNDDPDGAQTCPSGDADTISDLARRFLRLAADDQGAFERLGRYKTALWRQVCQTVFMLEVLRRQRFDRKWFPKSVHPGCSYSLSPSIFPRR